MLRIGLILALICCLMQLPIVGGDKAIANGKFRKQNMLEFLRLLDLQRPDLAEVKAALARGDADSAVKAYIIFFRNKEIVSPLLTNWSTIKRNPGYKNSRADGLLAGHFWDGYSVYEVPQSGFDWHSAPLSCATRFPILDVMRAAIHQTQNQKYIRFVVNHILDYIKAYPIDEFSGKISTDGWVNHTQVAKPWYWAMIPQRLTELSETVALIRNYPEVTDEELMQILQRMYQETDYLNKQIKFWVERRHNAAGAMIEALAQSCTILGDFTAANGWLAYDAEMLGQYLDTAYYPDGMSVELSIAYSSIGSKRIQQLAYALHNQPAVQVLRERIKVLVTCLTGLSDPTGWLPSYGDLYAGRIKSFVYQPGLTWLDLPWVQTVLQGNNGPKPPFTVWPVPGQEQWCGYYTMRSDWSPKGRYLAIDCGPWGTNHQHGDRLSFVITANGAKFIIDPSSTIYASNEPGAFIGIQPSGFLHNTITVDGVDEYRSEGTFNETHTPLHNVWEHSDRYTLFAGSYSFAPVKPIKWERRVLFVHGLYWLLQDVLAGKKKGGTQIEQNFQFEAGTQIEFKDNLTIARAPNGSRLVLMPLQSTLKPQITIGDKRPHITYWPTGKPTEVLRQEDSHAEKHGRGWTGRSRSKLMPAPAVTYVGKMNLPATITIALVPLTPGQTLADMPKITRAIDSEKTTWLLQAPQGPLRFLTSVAKCAVAN